MCSLSCYCIRYCIYLSITLIFSVPVKSQNKPFRYASVKIGNETHGVITSDDSLKLEGFLGSGFLIDTNTIITCYHVFSEPLKKPKYFVNMQGRIFPIKLYDSLPNFDIAIYKANTKITYRPLPLGNFNDTNIGDTIFYLGYDADKQSHVVSSARVSKIDSINVNGSEVKRIFFEGTAIPGYSGGPILNSNGDVIALIDQLIANRTPTGDIIRIIGNIGYSINALEDHLKPTHSDLK
jgi:S1-C subfamily serine protease